MPPPEAEGKPQKAAPAAGYSSAPSSDKKRYNELRPSPTGANFKLAVVEFSVKGATNGGSDKGPNGHRIDSIPIANSVIAAGGACEIIKYFDDKHDDFVSKVKDKDALIVRINPGQLSQGTIEGTQERFDNFMNELISKGKLVWSSPKIQTQMGAKDVRLRAEPHTPLANRAPPPSRHRVASLARALPPFFCPPSVPPLPPSCPSFPLSPLAL